MQLLAKLCWEDLDRVIGNDRPVNLGAISVAGPFRG